MLGCITASYNTSTVLLAVGVTAVMVLTLVVYAMQTKYDFTVCGAAICLVSVAMIVVIILAITTNVISQLLFGVLGALVAAFYIVFDVQLMLGGDHKYALDPDDYVVAALQIYIDIVLLFQYVL